VIRKVLTVFLLFIISVSLFAQQRRIDSLRNLILTAKEDTNKVKLLNNYVHDLEGQGLYPKGDSAVKITIELATKLNYKRGLVMATFNSAVLNDDQGNYANALTLYNKALQMFTELGDKHWVSNTLGNIGIVYWEQDDYPKALDSYINVLKLSEEMKDSDGIARNLANIGLLYQAQNKYKEALDYDTRALQMDEKLGQKNYVAILTSNIGLVYDGLQNHEMALNYYAKAMELFKALNDISGVSNVTRNEGSTYAKMGKYDEALKYFQQSLELDRQIGDKRGCANNLGNIGQAYQMKKQYPEAEKYLLEARILADSLKYLGMVKSVNTSLSDIYSATGRWQQAYEAYKLAAIAKDSMTNLDKSKEIGKLEAKADYDKQLLTQKNENERQAAIADAANQRQKMITILVVVIAIGIGIVAIIVFRSLKITRKQKGLIEMQKAMVEEKNKEVLDSITYAKRLQDAILPPMSVIQKHLPESFVLYKPKDIVAGDFYWMEKAGNTILVAAADCTGHGVPGALVSVVCSNALNRTVKEFKITEPGKILDKVRELVLETFEKSESDVKDGMDISLLAISQSPVTISWAGAYNSLWYTQNGEIKEIVADKQAIGKTDNPKPFTTHTLNINSNTDSREAGMFYLFTDGYADQFGGDKGKKFKYKQLQEKLVSVSRQPMAEQKKMLEETIEKWKGNLEQTDDICIIGIKV